MIVEVVQKWFDRYPVLENFIGAGNINLKLAREILEVDKDFMYDIFKELVAAGAVTVCSYNSWRATPELQQYLKERREVKRSGN